MINVLAKYMTPKIQKVQFESRYNGQDGDHHHHLSTAIDRATDKPHGTQLLASQLLVVVENRHGEVGQICTWQVHAR